MNKIFLCALLFLSSLTTAHALDIEGRVAYFLPQNHHIKSIYGSHGIPEYEVEVSQPLNSLFAVYPFNSLFCMDPCNQSWTMFGNFSYFQKCGHSRRCGDSTFSDFRRNSTKMNNWALNFGVKRYFDNCFISCLRPYLGLGIGFAHVKFNDHSRYVNQHIHRYGFALLAKFGFEYDITCNLYLDFFADYASNWFSAPRSKRCNATNRVNTGGFKTGLGIGYRF